MSDHSSVIVPLETWTFASPELKAAGEDIDIGLLAEALIYYDSVYVNVATQPHLAALIARFDREDALPEFFALIADGALRFLDFSFITTAVRADDRYVIMNLQDAVQAQPGTFDQRYLYHNEIRGVLPKTRHRERLLKVCRGRVVELKAAQFERGTENARRDALDPVKATLAVQALVDEAFRIAGSKAAPTVEAAIVPSADGTKHHINWNVNLSEVAAMFGPRVGFHLGQPLIAIATANRLIWGGAGLGADLYLGRPISRLVGNKLEESAQSTDATQELITSLQAEVEFPDVRTLINVGRLNLRDVLAIRKRSGRFRRWLQSEADRDRNALIAYHHEVAREAGFTRVGRRALSLFGVLGSGAAGGAVGALVAGPVAGAVAGAGVASAGYLLDVAAKLGAEWRPVVFGDWLTTRVSRVNNR